MFVVHFAWKLLVMSGEAQWLAYVVIVENKIVKYGFVCQIRQFRFRFRCERQKKI